MALRYSLAIPAAVVENLPARKAIRRSIVLSQGSRGRIFMLGLLISAIQIGSCWLPRSSSGSPRQAQGRAAGVAQIVQQVVGFFTNSFIGPMYATGLTLFYYASASAKRATTLSG